MAGGGWLGAPPPLDLDRASSRQRNWDEPRCAHAAHLISTGLDVVGKARLLAGQAKGSGSWLLALPSASLGLRLSDEETRVAVGLRLGSRPFREHKCVCGMMVEPDGRHGLACRRSAGRRCARHSMANVSHSSRVSKPENPGRAQNSVRLLRGDGKRPDGAHPDPPSLKANALSGTSRCPDTPCPLAP